jgi:hypothetical protein
MVLYTVTIYDWKMIVVLLSKKNAVYGLVRRIEKTGVPALAVHGRWGYTFELLSMENSVTLLLSTSFVDTAFIIMELNYSFVCHDISFWLIGFPYVGLV